MITEKEMSREALTLVHKSIKASIELMHTSVPKIKKMKVKGNPIGSESDLFDLYAADMLTASQYDKALDKFHALNAERTQLEKDMADAEAYLRQIINVLGMDILEKAEAEA